MIVTIHQPEHLPWLGFFHKMARADVYVFLDSVQFERGGWQNRNRIAADNAQGWQWVTVPVRKKERSGQRIDEVEANNAQEWGKGCWGRIYDAYHEHPHFGAHREFFEGVYVRQHWTKLVDLNMHIIAYLASEFGLTERRFVRSSTLGVEGKATDLLLAICQEIGATTYLSGPVGRDYLELGKFGEAGIEVAFDDFTHPEYPQAGREGFVSHLSAADFLFNCGAEAFREAVGL